MGKKGSMTLPTKITIIRLVMIPLILVSYCLQELNKYVFIVTASLFVIASMTDYLDGYIARKYNLVSDLGKLLDPIADKVLVAAALFILVEGNYISDIPFIALICSVIIIAREFMIGVLRQVAALKGVAIAADKLGKIKTASTLCGLTFLLYSRNDAFACTVLRYIGTAFFILATIVTVISGINYIVKNTQLFFGETKEEQSLEQEESQAVENEDKE